MADNHKFHTNSRVTEDTNGEYKLELNLTPESNVNNWTFDFELPYKIVAADDVNIADYGDGRYTISGKDSWGSLGGGESITINFTIKDNGGEALPLQLNGSTLSDNFYQDCGDDFQNHQTTSPSQDPVVQIDDGSRIISVDNDYGGNLEQAIAAANDGEVVQLGNRTYYTSGIVINKDITIDGQEGSVVNGGGTSNTIFTLYSGASGATIRDLEITNGNNGIFGSGATNVTLRNLDVHNIGISQTIRDGQNNTGIAFGDATGLRLLNSKIHNIGRKAVAVGDTDGAVIRNIDVYDVNLKAQHSQAHDAAGIKFFNTHDILLKDSSFQDINANFIWNDTTRATTMENNEVINVGEDFLIPSFNQYVDISGIYDEKSYGSIVKDNYGSAVNGKHAYNATEYTTETLTMENNDFSDVKLGSTDYWVNQDIEIRIAETINPFEADFSLFAQEYNNQLNAG